MDPHPFFAQPSQSGPPPQQNEQPDNNQPTSTQESNSSSNTNTTQETNGTKAPPEAAAAPPAQAAYKAQAVIDRLLTAPDNNLIELFETPEADKNDSASQDAASVERFAKEDEPAFASSRAEPEPREDSRQPLDMAV